MAPRRGGGGYSSGYSSCPDAFTDSITQVSLAYTCVYLAFFIGISIAFAFVRKRSGAGKKLIGVPYGVALFFITLSYILDLANSVLIECQTTGYSTYYSISIASSIFYGLGAWGLFFVVVYQLNTMLRENLGGRTGVFRIVPLVIVGVMFAITVGYLGLSSYNLWTETNAGYNNGSWLYLPQEKLQLVRQVLYLLGLMASGALSMMTIFSMRSRSLSGGDLIGWVSALYISMLISILLQLVFAAQYLNDQAFLWGTSIAISFVLTFFQTLSFVILLCIAKHVSWNKTTATAPQAYAPVMQQQTAYGRSYPTNAQHEYYQQAPVYVHPR